MLTTTVDGLWVLQVLTGIEVIAPELGLRPHLPSVESPQFALAHPVCADLLETGVITEAGTVDQAIVEWLTVLSRRDVALVIDARPIGSPDAGARVLLARFAQWWVSLERAGDMVRLSGAGTASAEGAANNIITTQIERLCGTMLPASFRPVTLNVDELLSGVKDQQSLRRFLLAQKLDAEQIQTLTLAADTTRSAQASIVALQSGVARVHIEPGAVTIMDTPEGRLVAEHMPHGGKSWMIVSPGSASNIASAVQSMVRRLPAEQEWFSYRKVV